MLYHQPSIRGFLLKHKECGKLGEKNSLDTQTDPVPAPLRDNGRSKWRVLKKRSQTPFFNTTSPNSTKALSHSSTFLKRTAIGKKSSLYSWRPKVEKSKLKTRGRKQMWHRRRDFIVQALIHHSQGIVLSG